MSVPKKIFIGIVSILPLIMLVIYMFFFFSVMLSAFRHNGHPEFVQEMMIENMIWIVASGLLIGLLSLSALIYFLVHAINNTAIDSTERLVWILVFIFAGAISKPIYWYMRIWKTTAKPV